MGPGTRLLLATGAWLASCVLFIACDRNRLPGIFRKNRSTLIPVLGILMLLSMAVHAWCLGVWLGRHPRIEASRQELNEYRRQQESKHGRATGISEKAERDTGEP